jgi:hypothetical protein
MRNTFKDFFPIRKPVSSTKVSDNLSERFGLQRRVPEGLGSSLHSFRSREVRGKYSRPIESDNGLYRLRYSVQGRSEVRRPETMGKTATAGESSPVSPVKPASVSPRKLPKEYIEELRAELEKEKQRRSELETRIQTMGKTT